MAESNELPVSPSRIGIKIVVALVFAGLLYLGRPLVHFVVYRVFYSPGMLFAVGIPFAIGVLLYFAPPFSGNDTPNKTTIITGVFVVGLALALVIGGLGGLYEERKLANDAMQDAQSVEEFPEVNEDNPRIVPRKVADVQTRGSVSYRQHQLGTSDIARTEDGDLSWGYPIQPDQFQNRLSGNQRGVLLSDMTTMENREMQAYDQQDFTHGEAMLLHRSAEWNLKKTDYMAQYRDDPTPFTHDGEAYMVYPKTGHEWHLTPVPHTTPTWEGVALVHTDGTIEHMSPEEARQSEILEGQRLYPLYNSQRKASSLEYRNGIVNQWPILGSFKNVVVPAHMPAGTGNSQPFVIDMDDERMDYVYALEPAGAQSRGLDEVWFFDGRNGEMEYFETGDETLLGPSRAVDIVRSEDSRTQWDTEETSGQFRVVEPVPTVVNGELWWHTKVVPVDNTDVTRNSFVSAHTGNVVEMQDTEAVIKFMSGMSPEELDNASVATEEASEGETADGYILIKEDGEVVDRIPVEQGQNVELEFSTEDSEQEAQNETTD